MLKNSPNLPTTSMSLVAYQIPCFIYKIRGHGHNFKLLMNFKIILDLNYQIEIGLPSCDYSLPPWLEDITRLCVYSRSPIHIRFFALELLKSGSKSTFVERQIAICKPSK